LHAGLTSIAKHWWKDLRSVTGLKRLVWAEACEDVRDAIQREKTMKHWPRAWKVRLINASNPEWEDLYDTLI
jgi:putative endonuclease